MEPQALNSEQKHICQDTGIEKDISQYIYDIFYERITTKWYNYTALLIVDYNHTALLLVDYNHTALLLVDYNYTALLLVDYNHTALLLVDYNHTALLLVDYNYTALLLVDIWPSQLYSLSHQCKFSSMLKI